MATLHAWIRQFGKNADKARSMDSSQTLSVSQLLEENRRLNKELAIAKEEKEILKKAATCVP